MANQTEEKETGGLGSLLGDLPTDELKDQTRELMTALGERAMAMATDKVGDLTGRLVDFVEGGFGTGGDDSDDDSDDGESEGASKGGGSKGGGLPMGKLLGIGATGVKQMVMNKIGGGGGGKGKSKAKAKTKNTIIEQIDVGVPVRVAYNQWTQFQDFPKFTRKIENVDQKSEEKVTWKAGIYFSHRSWESTIVEQVPDEHIIWRSKGEKGYIDGTVTFHEMAPNLTKILLVLEYHPQGLFERTGNAFRSQRRRARLELHQFDRKVMRETILEQEDLEGWRGEIRDGEVVRSHEDALEEEGDEGNENEDEGQDESEEPEGLADDEPEDEELDEEEEPEGEDEDLDQESEYDDEDEYTDEEEEPAPEGEDADEEDEDEADSPDDEYEDEWEDEPNEDDEEEEEEEGDEEDEEPTDEYEDEYEEEPEPEPEHAHGRRRRRAPALSR